MLTQHIALAPESYGINHSELARVSAALQKQITRDVGPRWNVNATVDAFPRLEDVPSGYCPIVLTSRPIGTRQGIHLDHNGQPYARIELSPLWSLHASRACIELLINPFGLRGVSIRSPRANQGPAELLVEVCAPCQDARYGYLLNGVLVSDFCTPAYFGAPSMTERYSFAGSIDTPFQVLPGGHITFRDLTTDRWWRKSYLDDCEVEAELNVDGARPRLGMPRAAVARALGAGDSLPQALVEIARAEHEITQAAQAAAQRLRAEMERQDETNDAQDVTFGMLVEAAPAPAPLPPTRAATLSVPPPLPTLSASSSTAPAANSLPPVAATEQTSATSAANGHSARTSTPWGTGAWITASVVTAVGVFSAGLLLRDVMLQPRPVQTPPAYAAAPESSPPVLPPPAPVEATPASKDVEPTAASVPNDEQHDDDAEAARERRRQRREAARLAATTSAVEQAPTVVPVQTEGKSARATVAVDPLDALLDTRE